MTDKVYLYDSIKVNSIRPLKDHVIVTDMNFQEKLSNGGIIILNNDGKLEGIHPRWGRVYAVGPEQTNIRVGQWICVKHGRWTRGLKIQDTEGEKTIRRIDNKDILLVSDEFINDETIADNMGIVNKKLY